jgi:hypothetical protein
MSDASLHATLRFLADDVRDYLEIGCREGDSLREVVMHAPLLQRVVICDLWGSDYGGTGRGGHDHIDKLLDDLGYTGERVFLDGDSRETVPTIRGTPGLRRFDLVLVDGDHSDEGALADLENAWPLVADGGKLLFHDICHPAHPGLMQVFTKFFLSADDCESVRRVFDGHGVGEARKYEPRIRR